MRMQIIDSKHRQSSNRNPRHLRTCTCCGKTPSAWNYIGEQSYPAKYATASSFKAKLDSGVYNWNSDRTSFGVSMFDCADCQSTFPDTKSTQ